jgi:hypothetical protein
MVSKLRPLSRRHFAVTAVSAGASLLSSARLFAAGPKVSSEELIATDRQPSKPGAITSFTSLKQIDAGQLNVGYAEAGPQMVPR